MSQAQPQCGDQSGDQCDDQCGDPLEATRRSAARLNWVTVADSARPARVDAGRLSRWRTLAPLVAGAVVVVVMVAVFGSLAAGRLAERESVKDASTSADLLADTVVQPALRDGLVTGDPAASRAMDRAVKAHVLGDSSVRVKIWTLEGRILYSDEQRLVGRTYPLAPEEREVLAKPETRADVSDLDEPENVFERGQGKLLEVYRPIWAPNGDTLLFETYSRYDGVAARAEELRQGFAGIVLSSLLALIVLMVPVVWRLLGKVGQAQRQREALLQRAVDASTDERRRIAGNLHDGVVQELTGASLLVSGAAGRAEAVGEPALAAHLAEAASTVRRSLTSMRSLLVDIYPPNLATSGLHVALEDLATVLRSRGVPVELSLGPQEAVSLHPQADRLVYRVAHECLLNAGKHARASRVAVSLHREPAGATLLEVADDGVGFDPTVVRDDPQEGHFGLRVLSDIAREEGADLRVASAPGRGTLWRLRVRPA